MHRSLLFSLLALTPAVLLGESATPSLGYTGAPTDHSGQNCTACHNTAPVNSDPLGSLTVTVEDYKPGIQQTIRILMQHPQKTRFGFQMTIREESNQTQSAGTFTSASSFVQVACDDGSQFGSAPPCTTARQFAEHKNAPTGSGTMSFEFDVLWMPPSQEVGRVDVYVAAVAGDGDQTAAGDSVYTVVKTLSNAGTCSLGPGVPTLVNAKNGASFLFPFSSNSMISVFGTGFQTSGHTRLVGLGDLVNNAFPTALSCVSVEVTGPGLAQPVLLPIAYVQFDQINAQMPVFSGVGPVTLTVILNPGAPTELRSDAAMLDALAPVAPAFFVASGTTTLAGQVVVNHTPLTLGDPAVIPGGHAAQPGEVVILYGTGFGDTTPAVATGQLAPPGLDPMTTSFTITIGSVTLSSSDTANVRYAGLSPGSLAGLYQFNVVVPTSTANGDIPVSIAIGGVQTQPGVTIPVQQP
jgi:uncharacterized protein (TIGR03437 family)